MLPSLRSPHPRTRRQTSHLNPITYENGTSSAFFHPPGSEYFTTQVVPNGESFFNPPGHLHVYQTERFRVRSGTGIWTIPTSSDPQLRHGKIITGPPGSDPCAEGSESFAQVSEPFAQGSGGTGSQANEIDLPPGGIHVFRNPSPTTPLEIDIALTGGTMDPGSEEKFFRNFAGYMDDCKREGVEPSLFQLGLFLWTVDTPLGVPVPGPDWVRLWVSWGVCFLLGVVVGEWVLGYRRSYGEYHGEEGAKTK